MSKTATVKLQGKQVKLSQLDSEVTHITKTHFTTVECVIDKIKYNANFSIQVCEDLNIGSCDILNVDFLDWSDNEEPFPGETGTNSRFIEGVAQWLLNNFEVPDEEE